VDTRSTAPDFRLAMEEIVLWSDHNPGHVPLILLFEPKNDYSFLDPSLGPWDHSAFDRLDAELRRDLGSRLYTPADFLARMPSATSLQAVRDALGWPSLGDLRGKIIIVLHENEQYRDLYEAGDPNLHSRVMFDCLPDGKDGALFAILNDPIEEGGLIRDAIAAGVMVRTRADADMNLDSANLEAAITTGAQIISTDFPPAYDPGPGGYTASLPGGVTMDALPSVPKNVGKESWKDDQIR